MESQEDRTPALSPNELGPRMMIVEGEKDVDRLRKLKWPATCNSGGAGKWRAGHTRALRDASVTNVTIIADNDPPGATHARAVASLCVRGASGHASSHCLLNSWTPRISSTTPTRTASPRAHRPSPCCAERPRCSRRRGTRRRSSPRSRPTRSWRIHTIACWVSRETRWCSASVPGEYF